MRGKTIVMLALFLAGIYYFKYGEPYLARQYAYPLEYSNVVQDAANEYNVSYSLIAGVILAESKFNETAESGSGALGLMQLMPDTAHWIAEEMNQPTMTDADIKEPVANIKMGSWYLAYLLKEFQGNEVLALAAYNAGRGHVEGWMKTYNWDYDFNDISKIPFPETRVYVNNVLTNKEKYESLYTSIIDDKVEADRAASKPKDNIFKPLEDSSNRMYPEVK